MARIGEGQGFISNKFKKTIYVIRGNNHQNKGIACAVAFEGQNEGSVLLVTDTWNDPEPITECRLHRYSRKKQHFDDYQLKPSRITQRGPFSLVLCDGKDSSFKIKSLHKKCLSVQQLKRDFRVYTIYQDKCKVLELKYIDGSYNLMDQGLYDLTLCGSPIIDEDTCNFKKYLVGVLIINAGGKAIPRFLSKGVLDQPEFTAHPHSQTLVQGSSVTFSSDANGIPEPTFSWTKDGSAVTANDRISLSSDNKELSITNVNGTDSGEYRCVVTNNVGKVNSNAAVLIVHCQPEFTVHPKSQTLVQGSSVTFSSDANGIPEPTFSWTKDGSAVTANDRISLSSDNKELSITNVNGTDNGEYRCVAINSVNTVNYNAATLTVQDAVGQHQWYQRVRTAIQIANALTDGIWKIVDVVMKSSVSALAFVLIRFLWNVGLNNSIGCKGTLEGTPKNKEEEYKEPDQTRARMAMSKREGEVPADDSREDNIATSAVSSQKQEPDWVEAKEDLDQMRKGIEELLDKPNISKAEEERNEIEAKEDLDQMRKGIEELLDKPNISKAEEERNENPRKRDVAFTTASSAGEQTMRKDVECEIPAAAVTDVAERGGTCSKVLKPQYCTADLHYNQTFVPESNQSSYSVLQDIVNYKCSSEFEKYLCNTSVPPCEPDDMSVYVPWRDICEQVVDVCAGKFENTRICNPDSSLAYIAEIVTAGDPRKRDVAFTTASSEGEQTMRKDVECEIPAAAVADVAERGGACSKVFKPQYCTTLHFNQTFVPDSNQSSYSVLQDTSNYKCSSQFVTICSTKSQDVTFVYKISTSRTSLDNIKRQIVKFIWGLLGDNQPYKARSSEITSCTCPCSFAGYLTNQELFCMGMGNGLEGGYFSHLPSRICNPDRSLAYL